MPFKSYEILTLLYWWCKKRFSLEFKHILNDGWPISEPWGIDRYRDFMKGLNSTHILKQFTEYNSMSFNSSDHQRSQLSVDLAGKKVDSTDRLKISPLTHSLTALSLLRPLWPYLSKMFYHPKVLVDHCIQARCQ